jgi:hypothetical protein
MIRQAALLGVLVLCVAATTATSATEATRATQWLPSPARKLAALDCRCVPDSARVARYQRILARLSKKCKESAERLGYISTVATQGLRQSGHRRTNLWMLVQVDQRIPEPVRARQPCRYVFALVVTSI